MAYLKFTELLLNCQNFCDTIFKMSQKQYNPAVDILRVISIWAVILIHTTTRTIESVRLNISLIPWTIFLNQSARFAVPLFFMISGFVLELNHSSNINYFQYLKRRLSKIFIPYLFWSAVYYYLIYTDHNISFLNALYLGSSSYQLYFIPTILIFYLIFPILSKFYGLIANKWVLAFLGLVQIYFLYQDYYVHPLTYDYPVNITILNFYLFLLGMVASKHQTFILNLAKKWKLLILPASAIAMTYVFLEGYNSYLKTHNYYNFYSQWRPSVLFYSIVIGIFLFYIFNKKFFQPSVVKNISKLSFFVFFIHVIVLELAWSNVGISLYKSNPQMVKQLWFDPLFFSVVAGISFAAAFVAHKIPYLSRLTG